MPQQKVEVPAELEEMTFPPEAYLTDSQPPEPPSPTPTHLDGTPEQPQGPPPDLADAKDGCKYRVL